MRKYSISQLQDTLEAGFRMAVAATSDNKLCVTVESKNSCPTRRNSDIGDVICCLQRTQ